LDLRNDAEIQAYTASVMLPVSWNIGTENYNPAGVFSFTNSNQTNITVSKRGIVDLE